MLELFEHLGQTPTIVGGISLGAAITMELTKHLEVEQLIVCRPAFAPDGDTSHFDVFRRLRDILQSQPQDQWASASSNNLNFRALRKQHRAIGKLSTTSRTSTPPGTHDLDGCSGD